MMTGWCKGDRAKRDNRSRGIKYMFSECLSHSKTFYGSSMEYFYTGSAVVAMMIKGLNKTSFVFFVSTKD